MHTFTTLKMIHTLRYLFAILLINQIAYCQVKFLPTKDLETALKLAQSQHKLIFIQVEGDNCNQCNEVADKGLSGSLLTEKFDKHFVSFRAKSDTPFTEQLKEKYTLTAMPVSLFLDARGNLIHRFLGSNSADFIYAKEADIAISRKEDTPMDQLHSQFQKGDHRPSFLENYLDRLKQLKLPNTDVLNTFTGTLPVDSLSSPRIIKFVLENAPSLDSKPYLLLNAANSVDHGMEKLYRTIPYSEAAAINNGIIHTTFTKAVSERNNRLLFQLSYFISNTYNKERQLGNETSQMYVKKYHYAIGDTMAYLSWAKDANSAALPFWTVDSLIQRDETYMEKVKPQRPTSFGTYTFQFQAPSQYIPINLNEDAWHFYEMTNLKGNLEIALEWSKRSMELFAGLNRKRNLPVENPAFMDTYAHLLYRLGRKEEAIQWQTKAVEAQLTSGITIGSISESLEKMKNGTL